MRLPEDQIGISDLLQHRSCPAKFAYKMRRHTEAPPPETLNADNAYGSAIHECIQLLTEDPNRPSEEVVTQVWPRYEAYLDPEDLALLTEDLERFQHDSPLGMELIASEVDARVPLFEHEGRTMYFRFKLDALYRRKSEPSVFYHRDYKSSKWRKSQSEVDDDPQMWAYNWAIHELYPECGTLLQSYEQLRHGNILTSKDDEQRAHMKAWLIECVKSVLADETLEPRQEPFCTHCPLVVTCPVTLASTRYWRGLLGVLAPIEKEGRKTKVAFLDEAKDVEEMIRLLPTMMQTRKHIEAVEKRLKAVIEEMPASERERLGWRLRDRKTSTLPPEALRALHSALGDSFYEAVSVSKVALEKVAGKPELELAKELELERVSATTIVPL